MVTQPQRYRFSLAEYDRMVEKSIFREEARLELIDGEIIQMAPIGDRHVDFVRRFRRAFARLEDDGLVVLSVQDPIRLKDWHEPQPDGYHSIQLVRAGDQLAPLACAEINLDTERLLK